MNRDENRGLDRFDLLEIGLLGVSEGISFGKLAFLIIVSSLVLTATVWLVVGALM